MHLLMEMHAWTADELFDFEERASTMEADSSREHANIMAFRAVYALKYGVIYSGPRMGMG